MQSPSENRNLGHQQLLRKDWSLLQVNVTVNRVHILGQGQGITKKIEVLDGLDWYLVYTYSIHVV